MSQAGSQCRGGGALHWSEGVLHWSIHCLQGFHPNRNLPRLFPNSIRPLLRYHLHVASPTLPLYLILCGLPPTTLISLLPLAYFPIHFPQCLLLACRAMVDIPVHSPAARKLSAIQQTCLFCPQPLPPLASMHIDSYLVTLRALLPAHLSPRQDWGHELCNPESLEFPNSDLLRAQPLTHSAD